MRYPTAIGAASSTTGVAPGYPLVDGADRVYKWTSSGSITF
jgi:hypothetical protein